MASDVCRRCKKTFVPSVSKAQYYIHICALCDTAYHKRHYKKNKDKYRLARARYYSIHADALRAYSIAWARKNKERKSRVDKEWRKKNKAKCKATHYTWRHSQQGKEKLAARRKKLREVTNQKQRLAWAAMTKEQKAVRAAKAKQCRQKNKEQIRMSKQRYWIANRDRICGERRRRYAENPQPIIARQKQWLEQNPVAKQRKKETSKEWTRRNADRVRQFYLATKDRRQERWQAYYVGDRKKKIQHERREYMRRAVADLSNSYIKFLLVLQKGETSDELISAKRQAVKLNRLTRRFKHEKEYETKKQIAGQIITLAEEICAGYDGRRPQQDAVRSAVKTRRP
jgi:hypothetical protein